MNVKLCVRVVPSRRVWSLTVADGVARPPPGGCQINDNKDPSESYAHPISIIGLIDLETHGIGNADR